MVELNYKAGNDNGNSEHDIILNGHLIKQPNVYKELNQLPYVDNKTPEELIPNLLENLIVTVQSSEVYGGKSGTFVIGEKAMKEHANPTSMRVRRGKKYRELLPIINTLGVIGGQAVIDAYQQKNQIVEDITVKVDMTTALPAMQWNPENAESFAKRFMDGSHRVTVHLNNTPVHVKVIFEYVYVQAEGVPYVFALQKGINGEVRKSDMFSEFAKTYNLHDVDGKWFLKKRVIPLDIGDGTTEAPVLDGFKFLSSLVDGEKIGPGHAIEEAFGKFKQDNPGLDKISRQDYSRYLKDPSSRYHDSAVTCMLPFLRSECENVLDFLERQLDAVKNELDVVCVYGGGSILMRKIVETFYEDIKDMVEDRGIKLFYTPTEYAVTLNAEGLYVFTTSKIFKDLKEHHDHAVKS
ncbi:ParM/StbA family protein [Desertibacillus haloalkaliphilus]|uniref:ParM/StbA family protein n=1 Tax=Desertibacillus haloalkaliphilus TaxID=1328930 RepID=UPI001C26EF09|nr:ParM/StbA family protein [Desertibacillus haloalkaliphilus]MBU8908248.1 ParM/StbA family protein [Desertibacillus haloalkaliphilus]